MSSPRPRTNRRLYEIAPAPSPAPSKGNWFKDNQAASIGIVVAALIALLSLYKSVDSMFASKEALTEVKAQVQLKADKSEVTTGLDNISHSLGELRDWQKAAAQQGKADAEGERKAVQDLHDDVVELKTKQEIMIQGQQQQRQPDLKGR